MQRSSEDIVDWNMNKVESLTIRFQRQMKEVCERVRYDHFDVFQANMIVNNMLITLDLLDTDLKRLLDTFKFDNDDTVPSRKRTGNLSGKGMKSGRRWQSVKDLTSDESRKRWDEDQSRITAGNQLPSGQETDSMSFNNLVKQVKTLEVFVISGKLVERVEKMEQLQNSQNVLQRLEEVERKLPPSDLSQRVDKIEKVTQVSIDAKFGKLETSVQQALKGVFGSNSVTHYDEGSPCIVDQLSNFENRLNEGKAEIHSIGTKDSQMESIRRQPPTECDTEEIDYESENEVDSVSSQPTCSDSVQDVQFAMVLTHDGCFDDGIAIRDVQNVHVNNGGAFDEDKCWFVAPVDGTYRFCLMLKRSENGITKVEAWSYRVTNGGWVERLFFVDLTGNGKFRKYGCYKYVEEGMAVRLRVFGGTAFDTCTFEGSLQDY